MLRILVIGATGRFSGIVDQLLARGHTVRAITRDPSSPAAQVVSAAGAEIVRGDLDERASLLAAARGIDAVFAAGTLHRAGPDGDIRHGMAITDTVRAARVPHLLYVSVAGAETEADVPLFRSKRAVEAYIRKSGVPATILAPVYFMENVFMPWWQPFLRAGKFPLALPAGTRMQQVPVADVTVAAAAAIERRDDFLGERMIIASDAISGSDGARAISRVVGATVPFEEVPIERLPEGVQRLFLHMRAMGFGADIPAVRAAFPDTRWHTFEEWAAGQDWAAIHAAARRKE
jgi:uncharacterized protein YbjT (DUF2867 family)